MRVVPSLAAALLGLAAPAATPVLAQAPAAPPSARPAAADPAGGRVITQDVYDLWRSIQGATLSDDGRWIAYSVTPAVGDGELVVRATTGATEFRVPRGWLGRPVTRVTGGGAPSLPPAQISADSRWVAALAYAPMAEFERARRAGRRAPQPRPSLALVSLPGGEVTRVANVRSFRLPAEGGRWIAYLMEPADTTGGRDTTAAAAPNVAAAAPGAAPRPVAGDSGARPREPRKEAGNTLVLRDLASGAETRIEGVTEYLFDEAGRRLGYTVSTADGARDGAYVRDLEAGREIALHTGRGNYKQLAFDEAGTQAAFVSDVAEFGRPGARYALYHAALRDGRAASVVTPDALGGEVVSDRADVRFVPSGAAVEFGVAPAPLDSIPADSLADKAVFDLWHYKDARLQPQQIVEAGRDRSRAYAAVWHVGPRRLVRLANDSQPTVTLTDDARTALAVTDVPYALEGMWGDGGSDLWLIDARTGDRRLVARDVDGRAQLSPGGKYVVWFDSSRWWSHDVAAARTVDLTGALPVRFDQETWDTPSTPAPWGLAGWTARDGRVLVHDRFDVWELDPAGRAPARALTDSVGRRSGMVFRVVNLAERRGGGDEPIDPAQPLLLSAMDTATKAHGFWEDHIGAAQAPRRILMADREFGTPRRSEDGGTWMVTQETVREFPDLWVGPSLTQLAKVSDANPQQSQYRWADVELVSWRSLDGRPLNGLLYKPDGFDPTRQYPMVVYFYEEHSDNLHSYVTPAGRNIVNPITYASHGYLVFFPDIAYEEGYPGRSALQSIVPGVNALVARGFVDPEAIGVAGQSWGGYQTAYMITQTDVFAAAVANAPVANMTSAYGGIRWESGRARAFQYEKTQSRIGGSIWEYPMRFIENSPLFYADQVNTPVLMMHNDGDGAVPWYQGIEMFVALRRFGKEAYLVNYNGDGHNPRKRANQKDIDMRMLQFFGHHLKGEPMPDWMRRGIPFLEKGRDQIANTAEPAPAGTTAQPATQPGGQPPR